MTEQEINDHLNVKMSKFFNEPAPLTLYDWFYKKFESIYMVMSQMQVQHSMYTVQSIIKKVNGGLIEELTRHEISFMCKVWLAMPPINIEKDIQKFFAKRLILEEIAGKLDKDEMAKKTSLEREGISLRAVATKAGRLITA